ncbi:MAG: bifunctional riboflavin kinase/FAD synthetase [Bdellovibrionales bacterium]|nr:bifunctional riboflavin kinase/FAD synthetase [Bdellovibrionales bacterium]
MRIAKGIEDLDGAPPGAVVTVGNFDGVHLGHREILSRVVAHAGRIRGTPVVVTFRPHPHVVLREASEAYLLQTYEEKLECLEAAALVLEIPFNREFSNTSPEEFVDGILVKALGAKALYLGYDFALGRGRAGSVEVLRRLAGERGLEAHVVPPLDVEGAPVSSSRIRAALERGSVDEAAACLGRPFSLRGIVAKGDGRGRKIGVPTANLHMELRKVPKPGVYATRARWKGKWHASVTNVGYNPTFVVAGAESPLKVETHLFDFNEDMYGDRLEVEFLRRLRDERKFAGVDELLAQMRIDFAAARDSSRNLLDR